MEMHKEYTVNATAVYIWSYKDVCVPMPCRDRGRNQDNYLFTTYYIYSSVSPMTIGSHQLSRFVFEPSSLTGY